MHPEALLLRIRTGARHRLLVSMEIDSNTQLLPHQVRQTAIVPQVNPVALPRALLLVHTLSAEHVVVSLGTRGRAGEPDLLVRGLFVDNVSADVWERNREDASL